MEEALLEIGSDDEVTVDGESLDVADILRAQPTPRARAKAVHEWKRTPSPPGVGTNMP